MPELITQRELKQCSELADEVRRTTANHDALRSALTCKLKEGAEIELGSLTAFIQLSTPQKRFSFDALVKILGLTKADALKDQLPDSVSESLKIVEAK